MEIWIKYKNSKIQKTRINKNEYKKKCLKYLKERDLKHQDLLIPPKGYK